MTCWLVLYANVAFAAPEQAAITGLSQLLDAMHSATANFSQTIVDPEGNVLQTSKGVMRIVKPGYFWWQVKAPNKQLIAVKRHTLYFYQPDLSQLIIKPFSTASTQTPAALLLNGKANLLNEQYRATKTMDKSLTTFTLYPVSKDALLKSIKIAFNGQLIQALVLSDHFGRVTKVVFSNVRINSALSASAFHFTYPKGTDVIHES